MTDTQKQTIATPALDDGGAMYPAQGEVRHDPPTDFEIGQILTAHPEVLHLSAKSAADVLASARTARQREGTSAPVRMACAWEWIKGDVLHHGSGKAHHDTTRMRETRGVDNVTEYDPNFAPGRDKLGRKYDTVLSSYVLNVLPPEARRAAIADIAGATKPDGRALVVVWTPADLEGTKGTPEHDGIRTRSGSFQRGFTPEQLAAELRRAFGKVNLLHAADGFLIMRCMDPHRSKKAEPEPAPTEAAKQPEPDPPKPGELVAQARHLAHSLAHKVPGFVDRAARLTNDPKRIGVLRNFGPVLSDLLSHLEAIKVTGGHEASEVPSAFPAAAEQLLHVLLPLVSSIPVEAADARKAVNEAIAYLEALPDMLDDLSKADGDLDLDDLPDELEKVLVPGIGLVSTRSIDPVTIARWTDDQVREADLSLHAFHAELFAYTDRTTTGAESREDVINAHLHLLREMARRNLKHPGGPDELDAETRGLDPTAYEGIPEGDLQKWLAPFERQTAAIYPGGEQDFGSQVVLPEVLRHVRDIVLREPAVYLVGGVAVHGKSKGDIDLLIRGPFDEATRHAIRFRLGRMFPPELSRRVQFVHDDQGGPFTDNVPMYDLVLRRRNDLHVIRMAADLVKQADPFLDMPPKDATQRPAVFQYHFRGSSLHLDFRIKVNDHLVGWTLNNQKAGAVPAVDTVEQARRIADRFSVAGGRYTKPFAAPSQLRVQGKTRQPVAWLNLKDQVVEPGEVGATRLEAGVFVTADRPTVELGLQKPDAHEYFLTGKGADVRGILFMRKIGSTDGPLWTATITESALPGVLKPRAVATQSMPPKGYSAIPKTLEAVTPEQFRYWKASNPREAREIRDALVQSRHFTDDNVKVVDGQFRRTVRKLYVDQGDRLDQAPPVVDFALSRQDFRTSKDALRSEWHLSLDDGDGLRTWVLQADPATRPPQITAKQVHRTSKALLTFEGAVEPGAQVGDDVLNTTKHTTSGICVVDRGKATLLKRTQSVVRIRFAGDVLKGTHTLVAEEEGSDVWTMTPDAAPGRVPTEKAEPDHDTPAQACDFDPSWKVRAIVWKKTTPPDDPDAGAFHCAIGPIVKEDRDTWKGIKNVRGDTYADIGCTVPAPVFANVGDVLEVEVGDLVVGKSDDKRSITWSEPTVIGVTDRQPMSADQAEATIRKHEVEKRTASGLGGFEVLKSDEGERYVEGIVLEPTDEAAAGGMKPDAQNDVYSDDDVYNAMVFWAEHGMRIHDQHGKDISDKVKVLQCYCAPTGYTIGNRSVRPGTWILALRILDTDLWQAVRSGRRTGFSVGGLANREPVQ